MRHVDGHADGVHAFDDRNTEIADTAIHPFGGAAADTVLGVIGQLADALTEIVELVDVVRCVKVVGVLDADNIADPALVHHAVEIGHRINTPEDIRTFRCIGIEPGNEGEGAVAPAQADCRVKDVDAGGAQLFQVRIRDGVTVMD